MWNKTISVARIVLCLLVVAPVVVLAQGNPLNESGLPAEADWCNIQWPLSLSVIAGSLTERVYGRIYEAGITESGGANPSVSVQLGYGPVGTEPWGAGWTWTNASFNLQYGNSDEYMAKITAPGSEGSYSYCLRYSFDGMVNATYSDLDGAGSNAGYDFSASQLGPMTVVDASALTQFIRGDVNCDGSVNQADATLLQNHLFSGAAISCRVAADVNGDGSNPTTTDLSYLVAFLNSGGAPPPAPYPTCGPDPLGRVCEKVCGCTATSCCVGTTGNVDCDPGDGVDVADLTALIDYLFINYTPLCCEAEANCESVGGIDVGDVTSLIDNLFINFTPLPGCQ